ncbi:MAG: hypothetical protein GY874_11665 [Desulfobacteraceae bacterium]|nr:hypothetical protein [Desulfobacteraceae bacterium]
MKPITFKSQEYQIEGVLETVSDSHAAIITHPHPLYGADMNNSVVTALSGVCRQSGWSALRFNFRGVGRSAGQFDEGTGEQADLQSAIDYLKALNFQHILLAGYSFGAWIISLWSQSNVNHDHRIILVAPPVAFIDCSPIGRIQGLYSVIAGEHDDIAPPGKIKALLPVWQPDARMRIIKGAGHFFETHANELKKLFQQDIDGK